MRLIEQSEVYSRVCKLADETALAVHEWAFVAQKTVGVQLVTALDSIGANLVEGDGRGPSPDATRFWRYARGSAREARHWFHRAKARGYAAEEVCDRAVQELTEIVLMVQGLIRHREAVPGVVKETAAPYGLSNDFAWADEDCALSEENSLIPLFPYSPETK